MRLYILVLVFASLSCTRSSETPSMTEPDADTAAVLAVHEEYINAWLAGSGSEERVMALFEDNSRIQPSSMTPIEGKENLRAFWFPDDGSKTIINRFDASVLDIKILDSLAVITYNSILDWTYDLNTIHIEQMQIGINTFVCRKQPDESWMIWRAMWTDVYVKAK